MTRTHLMYHTSPEDIKEPYEYGRFGKGIFFSSDPYYMTTKDNPSLYSLEVNEDDVVDASSFFYRDDYKKLDPIVEEIMERFGVDEDTAQDLLSGHKSIFDVADEIPDFDIEEAGEWQYDLQKLAGEAAELLGYKGVYLVDEQGSTAMMNIFDVFDKLRKI